MAKSSRVLEKKMQRNFGLLSEQWDLLELFFCKIKLKNIESAYIRQESIKAENLDEIFQLFEESEDWTYTVAWIDCLQKGKTSAEVF